MNPSLKHLIALAGLGASTWVAALSTGQLVVLASGVPASSGLVNGLVVPALLVLGALAVPTRLSVTAMFTTYSVLAVPTVLLGPPGVYKIVVGLIAGLVADAVIALVGKRMGSLGYSLAFAVWGLLLAVLAYAAFSIEALALPGKESFIKAFPVLAVVFVVEAAIAGFGASTIFQRRQLRDGRTIRRLRAWLDDGEDSAA